MNTLLLYMVKTAVYIAGFYFVYFFFLSRDTLYTRNRSFILFSVILSFILPSISINFNHTGAIAYFGKTLSEVLVIAEKGVVIPDTQPTEGTSISTIILTVYITGVIILGFKLLHDAGSLLMLIIRHGRNPERLVRFKGLNTSGFSAMGYVFINQALAGDETEEVIRHEMNHLKLNHYIDIFLIELVTVLQWFNPVIYMINRSLRAVHEYQADEGCLNAGISVMNYQKLLLNHIFRSRIFTPSNSFSNPSLLRKRITMMSRERSGGLSSLKLLFAVPVVGIMLIISSSFRFPVADGDNNLLNLAKQNRNAVPLVGQYDDLRAPEQISTTVFTSTPAPPPPPPPQITQNAKVTVEKIEGEAIAEKEPEDAPSEIFVVVEEMPAFPGGDKGMMDYIYANIVYPEEAKARNISGRVTLRFAVRYDGKVDNVTVIKSVDPLLDNEAKRVISTLPLWKPGRQGGKAVNVWYSVPVTFQLK